MSLTRRAPSAFSSVLLLALLTSGSLALPLVRDASAQTNTVVATVPVGRSPHGAAFDPYNGYLYVTNGESDKVSVIDGATNTVVANVTVGDGPFADAFDSANGDVYVANVNPLPPRCNASCRPIPGTVSVIDGATNTVVANVTVGYFPNAIAFDSAVGNIYVTNWTSGTVSVIDGATNTVVTTLKIGSNPQTGYGPAGVAFDSANGDVYVASSSLVTLGGRISVIAGSNDTVVANVTMDSGPWGLAFDSANGVIYVTNYFSNTISVVGGSTNTVVANVSVGAHPLGMAFDPGNGELFVVNSGSNTVSVIATPPVIGSLWPWVILAIPAIAVAFACASLLLRGRPLRMVPDAPARDPAQT